LELEDTNHQELGVEGIGAGREAGLWVAVQGRLKKLAGGTWVEDLELGSYAGVHCTVTEFRKDVLAVATVERGFATLWPDHRLEAFDRAHGFSSDWITAVETDHEGNLWAGTAGGGLALLRPRQVQTVAPPDGWQGRSVLTVLRDRSGAMWVGTEGAGLYRHEGASWTNYSSSNGLSNPFVWSLAEDRQGSLWAGTWGAGLFIKTGDRFQRAAGTESIRTPVMALYPVEEGLWGGTHDGVFLYSGGKVAWFRPEDPAPDIRCLIKGEDSTLWAGTSGKGLLRIHKGEIKRFTRRDGLPSDSIRCLHQDEAGALWIGTFGGGLSRLKQGRFSTVGRPQGLPDNSIYDIQDDGAGCFWMSSCNGILRASKPELNGCADGTADTLHCLQYGRGDGMPTLECSGGLQPAGCKTLDGRLWFPTSRGLVAVDPGQVQTNQLPPPVVIENLLVNDEPLPGRASAGQRLTMSPGGRRFEFQYTALSFVAPERVRFQYRLEGLDAKWVNAGTRRTANYSYLPHGDYTFQVIACNNDNVWNRTGARLDFSILPYFWQTLWFQGLSLTTVVALVGGGVWYGTRRRMRRALELLERQRAIERERFRIARDIHDDLGASLTRINLLSQSVSRAVDGPEQVSQDLRRISDTVRQTMRTMDEIVWAVDPKHDTVDSLANYLSKLAQDLMAASDIRCRLDFPLHLPPWPLTAEVRHNLFLAFKEILHNAIRHSQASEVNITLQTEPEGFALIVEDNGSGFAIEPAAGQSFGSQTSAGRGHGLRNIRQRLTEIGGACEIVSQPGQGTRISLRVRLSGAGR